MEDLALELWRKMIGNLQKDGNLDKPLWEYEEEILKLMKDFNRKSTQNKV